MTVDEAKAAIARALSTIAPEVDLSTCDPTAPLARELDLDSMDLLTLLTELADDTGVEVPDTDVGPGWSLDDLAAQLASA